MTTHLALRAYALFAAVLLGGCGIVSSTHRSVTSVDAVAATNASYFLPRVKVRLVAERLPTTEQKISSERESKTATNETMQDGKKTTKTTSDSTETTKKTTASSAGDCTLTLKDTVLEPDPRYMFMLTHRQNIFADDQVTVTVAPNGLLTKVDVTSEGKVGEVLVKLAELAKEVMKASAGLPLAAAAVPPFHYEFLVDPTEPESLEVVNKALAARSCHLRVEVIGPDGRKIGTPSPAVTPPASACEIPSPADAYPPQPVTATPVPEKRAGIFFRPNLPYVVTFCTTRGAPEAMAVSQAVSVPNASPIFAVDFQRPWFVKSTQTVEFENGMLKSSTITKPSEAVGFVNIPVSIAKTIVSIPGELLKVRVDLTKDQTSLVEAQKNLLAQQQQLLQQKEDLRKAIEDLKKKQDAGQ